MELKEILMIVAAYLCGSIPFGLILYKLFKKDDIRKHGSGNIGATNVARNAGAAVGLLTFALDVFKGFLPIWVSSLIGIRFDTIAITLIALAAIAGHCFPVWLKFKGGKGVATGFGVFLAVSWQIVCIALAIFILSMLLFRIVSLSSIIGVLAFIIVTVFFGHVFDVDSLYLRLGGVLAGLVLIGKHHTNIVRLFKGEEKRFGVKKKTEQQES